MSLQHQNRDHTFPFFSSCRNSLNPRCSKTTPGGGGHRGSAPRWVLVGSGRDRRLPPVAGLAPRRGGARSDQHCVGQRRGEGSHHAGGRGGGEPGGEVSRHTGRSELAAAVA
jgi:hypothetical protein